MKTSWIMLWPFSLLTKHFELLKLPREPQFLNGSSHTEEQSKLYQCWQVYIPDILSTWHSYTTAAQSWVNPKLSYSHQPPELLPKTPTSFKWPTNREAWCSLIKTSIAELAPQRILYISNYLQKEFHSHKFFSKWRISVALESVHFWVVTLN